MCAHTDVVLVGVENPFSLPTRQLSRAKLPFSPYTAECTYTQTVVSSNRTPVLHHNTKGDSARCQTTTTTTTIMTDDDEVHIVSEFSPWSTPNDSHLCTIAARTLEEWENAANAEETPH